MGYPLPEPPLDTHQSPLHSSPFFSIALRILLHFSALFCTCQKLNLFLFKELRTLCQKCVVVAVPNVQTFNLQTFKRSPRPIAANLLWCHNPQRHGPAVGGGKHIARSRCLG